MTHEGVTVEAVGAVTYVTLDRPDVMNRFEGRMREVLAETLRRAGGDPTVRCVVVRGAGTAFSAGADINGMVALHAAALDGRVAEPRHPVARPVHDPCLSRWCRARAARAGRPR